MAKSVLSENKVPKNIWRVVTRISEILHDSEIQGYLVGGFVRDLILERPTKDIDVVVIGSGIHAAETCAKEMNVSKVSVFKNFGTAMFVAEGIDVEFVGARKESYTRDSRKPIVENGSLQDDQNRRDFTINALAIDLSKSEFGELIDPFDGIQDLENKTIRTPLAPEETYSDDPLRMMRAIRFASQLNFEIDRLSLQAISDQKGRIEIISKERITEEFNKILLSPKPSIGLDLLFKTGLLELIFPELHNLHGVDKRNNMSHKDNFYHTLKVVDNVAKQSDDLWLRWAALLHDIAKPATKRFSPEHGWTFHGHEDLGSRWVPNIFKRMKLPLDGKMKYVKKLVALHLRPIALTKEVATDSAIRRLIFEAGDDLEDLMILCACDITSKNRQKVARYLERFENLRVRLKDVEARDKIRNWQPPITGEKIMETFGIGPCKAIGDLKSAIKEAILEGEIPNNYEDAFTFMLTKAKQMGLEQPMKPENESN